MTIQLSRASINGNKIIVLRIVSFILRYLIRNSYEINVFTEYQTFISIGEGFAIYLVLLNEVLNDLLRSYQKSKKISK